MGRAPTKAKGRIKVWNESKESHDNIDSHVQIDMLRLTARKLPCATRVPSVREPGREHQDPSPPHCCVSTH